MEQVESGQRTDRHHSGLRNDSWRSTMMGAAKISRACVPNAPSWLRMFKTQRLEVLHVSAWLEKTTSCVNGIAIQCKGTPSADRARV